MTNFDNVYGGNYMTAATAPYGAELTVSGAKLVEMRDGKKKPLVEFKESEKGLVLNKNNYLTIKATLGPDSDAWVGAKITLGKTQVLFQGRMVESIYISAIKKPGATPSPAPTPTPAPTVPNDRTLLLQQIQNQGQKGIHVTALEQIMGIQGWPTQKFDENMLKLKQEGLVIEDSHFQVRAI